LTVEVKNGSFRYNSQPDLFKNLNFRVESGEILSILGPNGCGKTTLLKCILGLLDLMEGAIYINGEKSEQKNNAFHKQNIGYVPQIHQIPFSYTVLEIVLMGRARFVNTFSVPNTHDIEIAKQSLQILGISRLKDRIFTDLSGGEKQLVLISRALASGTETLIFDEPTSALDYRNQYAILEVMKRLKNERKFTIIMTTHHPEHALNVSDKVLLIGTNNVIFGDVDEALTEDNLKSVYGMEIKVINLSYGEKHFKGIFPLINL
jgi:iron complex transport system ATP-binding protein